MSAHDTHHFAKAVRNCMTEDKGISRSLAELGLVNPRISVIHEKGTQNHQVNVNFDLTDGDNIEGVARKFGVGLLPSVFQRLQKNGIMQNPRTEFFCIPHSAPNEKDVVVATFSFN